MAGKRDGRSVAVVLGASATGLMAAAALKTAYERVVVVERDALPPPGKPAARKGVAQGRHNHNITPRATQVLERLYPGLLETLEERGASVCDGGADGRWFIGGRRIPKAHIGAPQILASRPVLDNALLERLLAEPNVEVRDRTDVCGLVLDEQRARVRGVRLLSRESGKEEMLEADLVVDASGRGSRAPRWLSDLGFDAPEEEDMDVAVGYTTRTFVRRPEDLGGDRFVYVASVAPHSPRGSVAFAVDGDRWMVLLFAYGEKPPTDLDGFRRFASQLPSPDLMEIVGCEPLEEPAVYNFPKSTRRRFDRVRMPRDFIVMGDALQSTNPSWGLGVTSAALQAEVLLAKLARSGRPSDGFHKAATIAAAGVWGSVIMRDREFDCTKGKPSLPERLISKYLRAAFRRTQYDQDLARVVLGMVGHVRSPAALFRPDRAAGILIEAFFPRRPATPTAIAATAGA